MLSITRLGFAPETLRVVVRPAPDSTQVAVDLREAPVALSAVVVASTRNERRVTDEPTRVEITDREDVEEQIGGSPGVIAELLTESGGVRVQRTSPGSSGASVRIRGMRGRYTKILSDGLPLFGVTTEGLGPLQIPPIDLQRVEVIKGVASALYGRGYTLVADAHKQVERDNDRDGWIELPGFERFVARPRLFWSDSSGNSWFGTVGVTTETPRGGTLGPAVAQAIGRTRTRSARTPGPWGGTRCGRTRYSPYADRRRSSGARTGMER